MMGWNNTEGGWKQERSLDPLAELLVIQNARQRR